MPLQRAVIARGALAGAAAATIWGVQQPLDMRVFKVPYDDVALLGSAITTSRWKVPLGWVLHATNGALFGAVYAGVAPKVPLPSWARGPAAGLVEHAATWPLTAALPRLHPAWKELPQLWGSNAALAQATWRHLLFGTVMGELERRLNPPPAPELADYEVVVSTNGHGPADDVVLAALAADPPDA